MRLKEIDHRRTSMLFLTLFNRYDTPLWFFEDVQKKFEHRTPEYVYHVNLYQIGYHVYWSMN